MMGNRPAVDHHQPHLHLAIARLPGGTDRATGQRVPLRYGLCAPTAGRACDTTLEASSSLPVPDPVVSSEPEASFHHVHRQNRSPAIVPTRARCPDGRVDWPPAPALDRPKAVSRPLAHGWFSAPSHQGYSPGRIRATMSARPTSVPNRRPPSAQYARRNPVGLFSFFCPRPAVQRGSQDAAPGGPCVPNWRSHAVWSDRSPSRPPPSGCIRTRRLRYLWLSPCVDT